VNKLARILTVILIAFALSSLLVYRLRLGSTLRATRQGNGAPNLVEETRTVEGQIQAVDPGTKTLTVVNDAEEVMLDFDERTAILESGHPIQPTAITSEGLNWFQPNHRTPRILIDVSTLQSLESQGFSHFPASPTHIRLVYQRRLVLPSDGEASRSATASRLFPLSHRYPPTFAQLSWCRSCPNWKTKDPFAHHLHR